MSKTQFQTHHGMVDILPDETPKWQAFENLIREKARLFGFSEIRTPILEPTELIARGIGQLTDIVSKEMFSFSRGDDNYVLRPEGTAPVVRSFIQHRLDQRGGVQKLFYIGPMFRAERPQKGRQRQFHQFGVEVLGSSSMTADLEVISFLMSVTNDIGLPASLQINSVGDPESRANYKEALISYFTPFVSKLSEISQKRLQTNPMRILDSKEAEDQEIIVNAPFISDYLNAYCQEQYTKLKEGLHNLNIPFSENLRLVRGLDYYSLTAFELVSGDLGSQNALGGGGRYDYLAEELGGQATPAVGMAAGIERFLIAMKENNIDLASSPYLDVFFITRGEEAEKVAIKLAQSFRNSGIVCAYDLGGRSIKAQMKEANRSNSSYTVIIGESELAEQKATLRNMKESAEEMISFIDLESKIKSLLK